jgi:hypothetical protein
MMNFRAPARSEPKLMLRRFLLALLVVALTAGFMVPSETASGGMDCAQGMTAGACALACHAGACIAPVLGQPEPAVSAAQPFARPAARNSDRGRAPDTAPPKNSIA